LTKEAEMCRWMAWHGQSVPLNELLFKTKHGLIDQSLHSRLGAETTNGDGFGVGWYGAGKGPGVYRSVQPAWGNANLLHLAEHIESPLFLAHIRAAIGSPVQESNCHPFVHDGWLFVHNGFVADLRRVRRDLMLAVDPELYPDITGSTDSEVIFHLALTHGLEDDPLGALEQAIGIVEAVGEDHGVQYPFQGSMGVSDGKSLWAVRYSSEGRSRSLFASADVDAVRKLHPDNPRLQLLAEGDRMIVSEPLADLEGAWHEIPEAGAVIVLPDGALEHRSFTPRVRSAA
jgi:predicted glutamine amidotransferase